MLTGIDPMTWTDRAHVLQLVTDVRSPHNHIRVADVSPRAAGPLAGARRRLLLDDPATSTPSRSPAAPAAARSPPPTSTPSPRSRRSSRAVLGFGAGSTARALLHFHPDLSVHGWELDPAVLAVARDFFGLAELKKDHAARLSVHVGEPSSRRTTWRRN